MVRDFRRPGIHGGPLDRQPARPPPEHSSRDDHRSGTVAAHRRHRRGADSLRLYVLERLLRGPAHYGNLHGATRGPGLLRRPHWRLGRMHFIRATEKTAVVAAGRYFGAQYRAGMFFRTVGL